MERCLIVGAGRRLFNAMLMVVSIATAAITVGPNTALANSAAVEASFRGQGLYRAGARMIYLNTREQYVQAAYLIHALQNTYIGAFEQDWTEICDDPWEPWLCRRQYSGFGVRQYYLAWDLVSPTQIIDARSSRHDRIYFYLTDQGRRTLNAMFDSNGYAVLARGSERIGIGATDRAPTTLHPGYDRSFKTAFNWGFNLQFTFKSGSGETDFDIDFNQPWNPAHLFECNSQISCHVDTFERSYGQPPVDLLQFVQ